MGSHPVIEAILYLLIVVVCLFRDLLKTDLMPKKDETVSSGGGG